MFRLDRPFDAKALKKTLEDAGYSQTALAETLGIASPSERQDPEVVYRRVRTDSPYHVLVRLFWRNWNMRRNEGHPSMQKFSEPVLPGMHIILQHPTRREKGQSVR